MSKDNTLRPIHLEGGGKVTLHGSPGEVRVPDVRGCGVGGRAMTKKTCDWHEVGIWIDGVCYCSGCCTELVNATDVCREAVQAVLAAMVAEARNIDEPQCAMFIKGFAFEPVLTGLAGTRITE